WSPINNGLENGFGVFALALAIDPQTPTTLYVATFDGGFKSTNGGAEWRPSNNGLPAFSLIFTLVIDSQDPTTLHAGTDGDGVFKSTDGGSSWRVMKDGLTNQTVRELAISPSGTCLHASTLASVFDFATRPDANCTSASLVSAVLPASRSVQLGHTATAFATVINAGSFGGRAAVNASLAGSGDGAGITCGITQLTGAPTPFTFQTTDPDTNQLIGTRNTAVNIPPFGRQTFLISFETPFSVPSTEVQFGFNCTNTDLAPTIPG